jgi:pimeloyl-ACP methyl ester carboxylesterase
MRSSRASTPISASCDIWDLRPAPPSAGNPVESDLPVLLLSGQFDPITPSVFAEDAAAGLSAATLVTQDGRGHGIWVGNDCIGGIVDSFVADPSGELDTSCADVGVPVQWAQP